MLPAANANSRDFIESALKASDISYTISDNKVVTRWNDNVVVVSWVDTETDALYISGYSCTQVPIAKWALAYEKLNEVNQRSRVGFYLDSDGDIRVDYIADIDEMMKVRYQLEK